MTRAVLSTALSNEHHFPLLLTPLLYYQNPLRLALPVHALSLAPQFVQPPAVEYQLTSCSL